MKKDSRHHRSRGESEIQRSGSTIRPFISGMSLGVGMMYVLDPDRGNRRRAMAQQKLFRLVHLAGDALDKGVRDIEHRAEGLVHDARCLVSREHIPDEILEPRVRAKLGRVACHPGCIEVRAVKGQVTLVGPVPRGEAEAIANAVRQVRGVRHVESHLDEHDSSENIPGLQGGSQRSCDRPELLQENWAPGTRLIMGGLGVALIARALRHPGLLNSAAGVLGSALVARSGHRTRVADRLMDAIKPAPGPRASHGAEPGDALKKAMESAHPGRRDQAAG
jgi:hypothetical protein